MEPTLSHETEAIKVTADLKRAQIRAAVLIAFFFIQWLSIHLCFSWRFLKAAELLWADILVLFGSVILPILSAAFLIAFMLATAQGWRVLLGDFFSAGARNRWRGMLAGQVCIFVLLFSLTDVLLNHPGQLGNWGSILALIWFLLVLATVSLAMLALAPLHYWRNTAKQERHALWFAAFASSAVAGALSLKQFLWVWEPLRAATFWTAKDFLRLFYSDVVADPVTYILGTPVFSVVLKAGCSGYEGMGMVFVFLTSYLVAFRKEFRFPQVLVLLLLGTGAIWLLNALRIALLIAIGTSTSPRIAMEGFHSKAGWIAVIAVGLTLVVLAHRWFGIRSYAESKLEKTASPNEAYPLLLPIIALFSTTLLTGAFTADFEWLYPLRVVTVGAVLVYFWKQYDFRADRHVLEPLGIGTCIFLAWLLLVPTSSDTTREFAFNLAQSTPFVAALWLLFRFVGTTVVIPLAEELAFRGYLLGRVAGAKTDLCGTIPFSWTAIAVSSAAFGALHSNWRAGVVAGTAYAFARYRRGRISDAIIAHICTNSLLAVYVLATGEWSYW